MSVYSGFATRKLETEYNKYLYQIMYLMGVYVYKCETNQSFEKQLFASQFKSIYSKLINLEFRKHLPPNFSYALASLIELYSSPIPQIAAPKTEAPRYKSSRRYRVRDMRSTSINLINSSIQNIEQHMNNSSNQFGRDNTCNTSLGFQRIPNEPPAEKPDAMGDTAKGPFFTSKSCGRPNLRTHEPSEKINRHHVRLNDKKISSKFIEKILREKRLNKNLLNDNSMIHTPFVPSYIKTRSEDKPM